MIGFLGIVPLVLFIAKINEHEGFPSLWSAGGGVTTVTEVCLNFVCVCRRTSSGPLHPCVWEREQDRGVFFLPWELITALFPISRTVTFSRPSAVSLSISLSATTSTGHNAKLPPPLWNGLLLCVKKRPADISYSRPCTQLLPAHFHLSHFACADDGLFEVVTGLQL